MGDSHEFCLVAAFGNSASGAHLLAGYSDEVDDDLHECNPVYLVRIEKASCQVVETIPYPIVDLWSSSSGAIYMITADGFIETWINDERRRAPLGEAGVAGSCVFGFAGTTPAADQLVVCSDRLLYLRDPSGWKSFDLPEDVEMVSALHGLSADRIYLCTDGEGLHLWNGSEFAFIEGPEEEPLGVLMVGVDELIMTADHVHRLSDGVWTQLASPSAPTIAIARLGDSVYVGSEEGVMKMGESSFQLVTKGYCNSLTVMGESLLAGGPGQLQLFDGATWRCLKLPV